MTPPSLSRRAFLGTAAVVLAGCGGREEAVRGLDKRAGLQPGPAITPGNVAGLDLLGEFALGKAALLDLAFHPAGSLLIAGAADGSVRALNLRAGTARVAGRGAGPVLAVAIGADARMYWGGEDGTLQTVTGSVLDAGAPIRDIVLDTSGARLAFADGSGSIWRGSEGRWSKPRPAVDGPAVALGYSASGDMIAVAGADGSAVVLADRPARRVARLETGASGPLRGICWLEDGAIATAGDDGVVRILDPEGPLLRSLPAREGWRGPVAWLGAGPLLADAGEDGFVRLSEVESFRTLKTLRVLDGAVNGLAFSPAGRLLAAGCADGKVRVYGLPAGRRA